MEKTRIKGLWWVVPEDGGIRIFNEKGEESKGERLCRLTHEANCLPEVMVKMIVNVAGTKEEMMEEIKKLNG